MRLVEIRLLEGPNVFRLDPTVKVEVRVGRRRAWRGDRAGSQVTGTRLGATVPPREQPDEVVELVAWCRRLRTDAGEGVGGVAAHRGADPGHWVVSYPWSGGERARTVAEAAVDLASRDVSSGRRAALTGAQARRLARWQARIATARTDPPGWITDAVRAVPTISISGTNGKSTVSRLIAHILAGAGRHVGMTTSDGVYVAGRLVEPGDWTGPGGAAQVLGRHDVDAAVLETARGGILLRGIGYESNDASVLTNVSSDHLDLQGIHTLAELAEVKATICRITRPGGWVVLNADDPLVAAVGRQVAARLAYFSLRGDGPPVVRRHLATGGRAYLLPDGVLAEVEGPTVRPIAPARELPIALGGLARYNVANALAAAGGARAMGASLDEVAEGLRTFEPTTEGSPGRLNLFRLGRRIVLVDFAHNEAGVEAVLGVARGIAGGAAGRAAPVTVIVGTAGDRPDDTLRAIGRATARRADRVVVKETLSYLRGRAREEVVARILEGIAEGGIDPASVPVVESETLALQGELGRADEADGRPDPSRVIVLLCHEQRPEVMELLGELGAREVDVRAELTKLLPRLRDRSGRA
ncbi:MAG TPA: Mur ligase family protein [Candidatus Limnocylindrales bacterium]|nr:Mur ligase family protein [Candidatus Limnocylindrales bacterium]